MVADLPAHGEVASEAKRRAIALLTTRACLLALPALTAGLPIRLSTTRPSTAEPLFPFGHGLSYTRFGCRDLCARPGDGGG